MTVRFATFIQWFALACAVAANANAADEKQPTAKKDATSKDNKSEEKSEPAISDLAGTWKAKILFIKGKGMLIENLELTIKADGKGQVVYRVNQGGQFNVTFSEVKLKQDKIKDKSGKESGYVALSGFAGMEWIVRLKGKDQIELFGAVPTEKGPSIETLNLTRDSDKPRDKQEPKQ